MCVVADQGICPRINVFVRLLPLHGYGMECVLASPMQGEEDETMGIVGAEPTDALQEGVVALLTHAGFIGQIGIVLQGHAERGEQVNAARSIGKDNGLGSLLHVLSCPHGNHPCLLDVFLRI